MNRLLSLGLSLPVLLAGFAPGQDTLDLAQVREDLDYVFERPPGRVDRARATERFNAFWKKYAGKDLGRMSYARGLSLYWHREPDKAVVAFDEFLSKHDPKLIESAEQRNTIGRVYLGAAVRASRAEAVDGDRLVELAARFARCYDDVATVGHHVTKYLGEDKVTLAARARIAMAKEILGKGLAPHRAAAILAAIYTGPPARGRRAARPPQPKQRTLKPFSETAMSGRLIDLRSYRGRVVLVDFWATWCGPCLRELPNVVAAYEKHRGKGFEVIGISLDKPDAMAKIEAVAKRLGMTWEQIYDGGHWQAKLAKENGIRSIPAAFLLDRSGKVRFSGVDARGERLLENLAKLMGEKSVVR